MIPRIYKALRPTFVYWMATEVHVYAFSIAANVLLSFYPFILVITSMFRNVFHWTAATEAVNVAMDDFFPGYFADFVGRNLHPLKIEWVSILLLLFTANGVFEPLEVALNRVWGIRKNRSFLRNQMVSYGLIFVCGLLALMSASLTAVNQGVINNMLGGNATLAAFVSAAAFKMLAIPVMILAIFLVYYALPNGPMPRNRIIAAAIGVGLLLELLKYAGILLAPWLFAKLTREYGVFRMSVTIILYSFFASMLFLAGAEWASRPWRAEVTERLSKQPRGSDLVPPAPRE